jgi:glycosyltransferase involved in cell wall biosynthesis
VLIEAIARGLPVVSTRVSGIPDLLAHRRGSLVEPGDVSGLATTLAELLDDPEAAAAQAEAALRHVREHYTTEVNWAVLEGRIRSALATA